MSIFNVFLTNKASLTNFNIQIYGMRTTYADVGYETVFKVDDSETFVSGISNHRSRNNGCELITLLDGNAQSIFGNIVYKVTNFDQIPHNISIATDADIQIGFNDYADIYNIEGDKGFVMTVYVTQFSFLLRGLGCEDVDTYWYGKFTDRFDNLFNNGSREYLRATDSGMAFSWKDRVLQPNETKTFTIVSSKDQNVVQMPKISAKIRSNGPYHKNSESVSVEVGLNADNYKLFNFKCYFNDIGPLDLDTIFTEPNKNSYLVDFTLPQNAFLFNGPNTMTVYCVDNNNLISNFVDLTIDIILEPIQFNARISNHSTPYECPNDDYIRVIASAYDESGYGPVEIVARYNGDFEQILFSDDNRNIFINKAIEIWANGLGYKNNVSIFARNQCSGISQAYNFTFEYRCQKPILNLNQIDKYIVNSIRIAGEVRYSMNYNFITIYYYFDDDESSSQTLTRVYPYQSNFDQTISPKLLNGQHKITIYAQDKDRRKSDRYSYIFDFASSIPEINLYSPIQSNYSRTNNNITIYGLLRYQTNCNIYYFIDQGNPILLDLVTVNYYSKKGEFKFLISLDRTLSEGNHNLTIYAQAFDAYQTRSADIIQCFSFNVNKPKIEEFFMIENIFMNSDPVTMSLSVTTPDQTNTLIYAYYFDNNSTNIIEITQNLPEFETKINIEPMINISNNLNEGSHIIHFYVIDSDGVHSDEKQFQFSLIDPRPKLSLLHIYDEIINRQKENNEFAIFISASNYNRSIPLDFIYVIDNNSTHNIPIQQGQSPVRIPLDHNLSNGNHSLTVWVQNNIYKKSQIYNMSFEFLYQKPKLDLVKNISNLTRNIDKYLQIFVNYTDDDVNIGIIRYSLNNGTEISTNLSQENNDQYFTIDIPLDLPEGMNNISLYAIDNDNMESKHLNISFSYVYHDPVLFINNITKKKYIKFMHDKINISGNVTDLNLNNAIDIYYLIDSHEEKLTNFSFADESYDFSFEFDPPSYLKDGCYNISFVACDSYRHCSPYSSKQVFCYRKYPQTLSRDMFYIRHKYITRTVRE